MLRCLPVSRDTLPDLLNPPPLHFSQNTMRYPRWASGRCVEKNIGYLPL